MNRPSVIALVLSALVLVAACSDKAESNKASELSNSSQRNGQPITEKELETWLQGRYGELGPVVTMWASSGDGGAIGLFAYQLADDSIITIDAYSTKDGEKFVDPSFDLLSLPEATQ